MKSSRCDCRPCRQVADEGNRVLTAIADFLNGAYMWFCYERLLIEEPQALRYRSMKPGTVDELLESATGCVSGGIAGRPYLDIIVAMVPHRLEFETDAELRQVISQAQARGVPIHCDVEMMAVLVATGALMIAAVAYAIWLGF